MPNPSTLPPINEGDGDDVDKEAQPVFTVPLAIIVLVGVTTVLVLLIIAVAVVSALLIFLIAVYPNINVSTRCCHH